MQEGAEGPSALSDAELERYARQVLVEAIGYDGQARLLRQTIRVEGGGPMAELAGRYLAAAGLTVEPVEGPEQRVSVIAGDGRTWGLTVDPAVGVGAAMSGVGLLVAQVVLELAKPPGPGRPRVCGPGGQ